MNLNPLESRTPEPASNPRFIVPILTALVVLAASAIAQSPTPSPSAPSVTVSAVVSPSPASSPSATPSPSTAPVASPTPSLLKKTGIKIQFLPPPMEGAISLGIYDHTGKLVRVLHRAATGDEFVAALDGYITHWDGLDDAGKPLPPGRYSAKGYMVGAVTVHKETLLDSGTGATTAAFSTSLQTGTTTDVIETGFSCKFPDGKPFAPETKIHVVLVPNPLDRDRAGNAEISVGFDAGGSWLELTDGLPLVQISSTHNLKWAALGRSDFGGPLVVFQSDHVPIFEGLGQPEFTFQGPAPVLEEYAITKLSNMMSFDCGDFDFPGPSKQDGN